MLFSHHPYKRALHNTQHTTGSVILVIVFGFFVMMLHRGASKCAVIAAFAAIFYHLGLALLQKPHSELIGTWWVRGGYVVGTRWVRGGYAVGTWWVRGGWMGTARY